MPEEMCRVFEFIQNSGYQILNGYSSHAEPEPRIYNQSIDRSAYICPTDAISSIVFDRISESRYSINTFVSPIIEIAPSVLRQTELSRGRIYALFGYDGREHWVPHPESLVAAHNAIRLYLKKSILTKEKHLGAFISNEALLYQQRNGKLVQF
jgi:hypothetical protein